MTITIEYPKVQHVTPFKRVVHAHRAIPYRREIDGLRALAVLPVILFHAGFTPFSGGFVGVDVFFVISGYLITSIILSEMVQGNFSIIKFYERRARRILPPLFVVLAFSTLVSAFYLFPGDLKSYARSLIGTASFSSNISFFFEDGYFDDGEELKPLLHTWSLGVEEQFYILFPVFLILVTRLSNLVKVSILSSILVSSLIISQLGLKYIPSASFFLLPSRAWELLLGVLAAFLILEKGQPRKIPVFSEAMAFLGVGMILLSVAMFDKGTAFPGINALLPACGALLSILFATADTRTGVFLGNRVFVGLGLISYSAYLWHQPLFAFTRHAIDYPPIWLMLALSFFSIALAYLTWRFIERPFRNPQITTRKQILMLTGVGSLIFLVVGGGSYAVDGQLTDYNRGKFALINKQDAGKYVLARFIDLRAKPFSNDGRTKVLIIGDSFGEDVVNALYEGGSTNRIDISTHQIQSICGNLYVPREILVQIPSPINRAQCERKNWYDAPGLSERMREADWIWLVSSWLPKVAKLLPASVENLKRDYGDKIVVFNRKYFGHVSLRKFYSMNQSERLAYRSSVDKNDSAYADIHQATLLLRANFSSKNFIDIHRYFCSDQDECKLFTESGDLISFDGFHLTKEGATYLGHKLEYDEKIKKFMLPRKEAAYE